MSGAENRFDRLAATRAQARALAEEYAALAAEFRALHEQAQGLQTQHELSREEQRERFNDLLHAETALLAHARVLRLMLQRLVTRYLREPRW